MSEFARILSELIERGKQTKRFSIKELAQQAQITPSYLSNLKQSNRKPPAIKTLYKLIDGLRQLQVPENDIQQLLEAYNRQHLNYQEQNGLLESLSDEYKEEGTLFERVKQGVQTRGLVRKRSADVCDIPAHEYQKSGCFEGNHHAFITQAMALLETTHERGDLGGKIYITWFHHELFDDEFGQDGNAMRDMLRSFLWADSPFYAIHLWAGDITCNIKVIADFLAQYIGTSHCFLYEIPYGEHLPEYLVVEGVGFVEAKPMSDDRYWIRYETIEPHESSRASELQALVQYLEYLLGPPQQRKPLVRTNAPARKFSITPVTQKLADTETNNLKNELLLIKSSLSARFRPADSLRAALQGYGVPQDQIDIYLTHHLERIAAHENHLKSGKGRTIHERDFLKKEFRDILTRITHADSDKGNLQVLEAQLFRDQILQVIQTLIHHPNIHFALASQEFLIRFSISGNTAFLSFDPPDAEWELPLKRDDSLVRAWTKHPEVVYQLRHEFNMIWKGIEPEWRTDTEQGRQNVIHFFITEPLKALLNADIPASQLWAFMSQLIDRAGIEEAETFLREVCMHEQGAKDILIFSNTLPSLTLPVDAGPWDSRSSVRTRQLVFHALAREIERVEFIFPQKGIERYWETGQYGSHEFPHEWVSRHVQTFRAFLRKHPEQITALIFKNEEEFPINIEIIDGEYLTLQKADMADEDGGIIVHDQELVEMLRTYIRRNISLASMTQISGAHNVEDWLAKQFPDAI